MGIYFEGLIAYYTILYAIFIPLYKYFVYNLWS